MKNLKIALFLLLFVFPHLIHPAAAQQPTSPTLSQTATGTPRIGFVDVELVLSASRAIRSIMEDLDEELAREAGQIDERQREVRSIQLSLEQQGSVLSEAERKKRQERAIDLLEEIDEMEFRFKRRLEQTQRATVDPLIEQVIFMIADVGERDGYDLIVRGEMVLYGRTSVDLTPIVIREIDSRAEELRRKILPETEEPQKTDEEPLPLIP